LQPVHDPEPVRDDLGQTACVVFGSAPSRPDIVTPIQTATNQVLRPIKVGSLPTVIAITPEPHR
jgi:DNA-binding beta-propeller fold protein YncE